MITCPPPIPDLAALGALQDALLQRLTDGQITTAKMGEAFKAHVAALAEAGFSEQSATSLFWQAVATAQHVRSQPEAIVADGLYTVAEAARATSFHPKTISRWLRAGVVKGNRKLGHWRMRGAELLKIAG